MKQNLGRSCAKLPCCLIFLEWAADLTQKGKGKHFIGDFLPKQELDKFLGKVKAVKEGGEFVYEDYVEHKLTEENIGYKMLQKAGWEEGTGLGSAGEGIKAPINKYVIVYIILEGFDSPCLRNLSFLSTIPHEAVNSTKLDDCCLSKIFF